MSCLNSSCIKLARFDPKQLFELLDGKFHTLSINAECYLNDAGVEVFILFILFF